MSENFTSVSGLGVFHIHQCQLFFGLQKLTLELCVGQLGLVQSGLQALEVCGEIAVLSFQPVIGCKQRSENCKLQVQLNRSSMMKIFRITIFIFMLTL